jgi:uncharacterized membrane protein
MATTMTTPGRADRMAGPQHAGGEPGRKNGLGGAADWAALLGGGALALYGLTRASLGGVGLAALGGGLAYGASGRAGLAPFAGVVRPSAASRTSSSR